METGSIVSTFLTTVSGDMMTEITAALPIAGGIFAALAGIGIGVKLFKKLTGART